MKLWRRAQWTAAPIVLAVLLAHRLLTGQSGPGPGGELALPPGALPAGRPAVTELPSGEQVTLEPVKAQAIRLDQVGYLPPYRKIGLVAATAATSFKVVDVGTGRSVYAAELGRPVHDEEAGESVQVADFSNLTRPGTYTLVVPGVGRSPDFRVGDDVYQQLFTDALASYDLLASWAPAAWQTARARDRETAKELDVTGGWPDAGDYGRYMPTAAGTMGTLLMLADLFPTRAEAVLNLPGLRPDLPDYHAILKRELDWMLKMQRADGAVYHKVTPMGFGGFNKGDDNIGGELFAFDPSTPDAAVFAAVMAQASRVYRSVDGRYADRLLAAAEKSWRWLEQHPRAILPAELEGTGSYLYPDDASHRFWAAAELFKTTGKATYGNHARGYLEQTSITVEPLSWSNPQTYGLISYYFNERADPRWRQEIRATLGQWADGMATTVTSPINPFRVSISVYAWASNYGFNPVKNPHNRTIFSIGRIVPGVLVGGPNGAAQDGVAPVADGPRSYVDDVRAYSVNENSIEYNAPLVFVAAWFQAPIHGAPHRIVVGHQRARNRPLPSSREKG